ncbi:MAG TPA: SRPBCC family protein [Roseiarcus sp.]|nr:SRPBCC family protein [Roseiarcus sp.]
MTRFLAALCGGALLVYGLPALAVDSSYTAASQSPPDAVWAKLGDFCGIAKFLPGITCTLSDDGKVRTLKTPEGGVVVERLDNRDDAARTYSYTILEAGPLPVANYHSTISVQPAGVGSSVVWNGKYDAKGASDEDAKKAIDGIYKTGADNLTK